MDKKDNITTFEEVLQRDGVLMYTNVGDSMMPLLREGHDIMVIERKPEGKRLKCLDIPLYKRDSGQYVLHRILLVRRNDYIICGDNRKQFEAGITDRQILGVLKAVIKDGGKRTIKVDTLSFRIYSIRKWLRCVVLGTLSLMRRNIKNVIKKLINKK